MRSGLEYWTVPSQIDKPYLSLFSSQPHYAVVNIVVDKEIDTVFR
jgi:hypothetical protein